MNRHDKIEQEEAELAQAVADGNYTIHLDTPTELPPRLVEEAMVTFTVRMLPATYQQLRDMAAGRGIPVSTQVRRLLERSVAEPDDDQPVTVRLSDLRDAIAQAARRAA